MHRTALSAALLSLVASVSHAQLFDFVDGVPYAGVNGPIYAAVVWDADADGPMPAVCVVGGSFTVAGDKLARNVAMWNPQTEEWQPMGVQGEGPASAPNAVLSLFVTEANQLLLGDHSAPYHWTGSEWKRLGPPTDPSLPVTKFAEDALRNLYIVGVSPPSAPRLTPLASRRPLQRWTGSVWESINIDFAANVSEMTLTSQGDFYVGGGGLPLYRNPASGWQSLELPGGIVGSTDLLSHGNELIAAIGLHSRSVERFSNGAWTRLLRLNTADTFVESMLYDARGDLLVAGSIAGFTPVNPGIGLLISPTNLVRISPSGTASAVPAPRLLARIAPQFHAIFTLANLPDGRVLVGGSASQFLYDGTRLRTLSNGTNGRISRLVRFPNGDTLVLGDFDSFSTGDSVGVVRRTSTGWTSMSGRTLKIKQLAQSNTVSMLPDGTVYLWAEFVDENDVSVGTRVARFENDDWVLATGPSGLLQRLPYALRDGSLFTIHSPTVASTPRAYRFDGSQWRAFGQPLPNLTSVPPARDANGDVYLLQTVGTQPNRHQLLRLDNETWTPVGQPLVSDSPSKLSFVSGVPTVLASGAHQLINDSWVNISGNASIYKVESDADGNLYAIGTFSYPGSLQQFPRPCVARRVNSVWLPVTPPLQADFGSGPATITDFLLANDGSIEIAGNFTNAGNMVAMGYVRAIPSTRCDTIDFNTNGVFPEDQDVIDFLRVLAGDTCATCNDLDFNNDTVFVSDDDVTAFFSTLSGAPCP